MRRNPVLAIAGLSALCLAATLQAGEVYQWKDANGVTHYSQTPPEKGQYQQRAITNRGASQASAAEPAARQEHPQCTAARNNLQTLQAKVPVHEVDADGKPGRVLTDAERTSQIDIANAEIKAYCAPAPAY